MMNFFKKLSSFVVMVIAVLLAATLMVKQHAYADTLQDEQVIWQRAPIAVILPIGKERFVSFPDAVQFGYDVNALPNSTFRVDNDNHTLYLLAKQPFTAQRVEAKLASGEIVLLDVSAKAEASDSPLDIVLPASTVTASVSVNTTVNTQMPGIASDSSVNYVTLTRYAIQQLYAPERLLVPSMSVTRFPMQTTHIVPLFFDGSASAMPLASWHGKDLYVTALLIKNVLHQPLRLDPRLLCGDWKTASFYPQTTLASHGTPINRDTSTLFVISSQPFAEAITACLH
ncbi:MAG: TIGR03749 family integrating conjugative element protein [Gammaproteobacteria bacterium]|nr:TIGR03749 family integrating conjugative element protein [Gammaproteobacteria bacterium]MBY0544835.1 TIGR03749 family integrating conjugative element protein [Gammaproteobacteria bacterium]